MTQADIELVVPGLLDIPVHEFDRGFLKQQLPAINQCLRLASRIDVPPGSLDETLSECLQLPQRMLPMAEMTQQNGVLASGQSMLLEPVYLKPDISNVTVFPIERTDQSHQQVAELIAALGETFADELTFSPLFGQLYRADFIKLSAPDYYPHPLSVVGKSINQFIEQAKSDLDWYRLVTEMQMFLFDHPVNQQRQANGLYPVNSFWFWGGGESVQTDINRDVYSDDELIRLLFDGSAKRVSSLEDAAAFENPSLVVALQLISVLKSAQSSSLEGILLDLEEKIFKPAVESVQQSGKTLRLRSLWRDDFFLQRLHRWRLWRRQQSIEDLVGSDLQVV